MQIHGGIASEPHAASVSCPGIAAEGVLREEPPLAAAPTADPAHGTSHSLHLSGDLRAVTICLCPEAAWATAAVAQDIQALLRERRSVLVW